MMRHINVDIRQSLAKNIRFIVMCVCVCVCDVIRLVVEKEPDRIYMNVSFIPESLLANKTFN